MLETAPVWLFAGLGILAIAGLLCLRQVRRDLRERQQLRVGTAFTVWAVYFAFTGAAIWVSWQGILPLPLHPVFASIAGTALILFGVGFTAAGMLEFRSFARMSGRRQDRLVKSGVYRWSRNPQNVGWGFALLGIAIAGKSGLALVFALFFWTALRLYIPTEERHLARAYGEEWRDFRDSTPRFFGPPRRGEQRSIPHTSLEAPPESS